MDNQIDKLMQHCIYEKSRKSSMNLLEPVTFPNDPFEYSYNDYNRLKEMQLTVPQSMSTIYVKRKVEKLRLSETSNNGPYVVVILNGLFSPELSCLDGLPQGLHVDKLESLQ